ncbi:DUF6894 family protein [Methylorubrum extorquens]|uniref:DUF6894 domain-containing protein n=1 Tax=Methylorubrum extorquens TaxID=408 RepID=A0AAX3WCD0_METEX|nr:hypothetical protein [Methylorubrum extorquens]WHQ68616.1 hypothetical protein KEC54_19905 [Methylorubrum extorquens]
MTVQRYHFHCVGGGGDVVFDLSGRWVPRLRALGLQADRVAQAIMAGAPDTDWSDWLVDVHDACGRRVLVRAFEDARSAKRSETFD